MLSNKHRAGRLVIGGLAAVCFAASTVSTAATTFVSERQSLTAAARSGDRSAATKLFDGALTCRRFAGLDAFFTRAAADPESFANSDNRLAALSTEQLDEVSANRRFVETNSAYCSGAPSDTPTLLEAAALAADGGNPDAASCYVFLAQQDMSSSLDADVARRTDTYMREGLGRGDWRFVTLGLARNLSDRPSQVGARNSVSADDRLMWEYVGFLAQGTDPLSDPDFKATHRAVTEKQHATARESAAHVLKPFANSGPYQRDTDVCRL